MSATRRIALIFPYDLGYCRGILRGIRGFARLRPDWLFTPVDPAGDLPRALRELKPCGIIAHVYSTPLSKALQRARCPVVNVAGVLPRAPFPSVGLDNLAIGTMAAEHFLAGGFRHFAFAGHSDQLYSCLREQGFRERLAREDHSVQSYHLRHARFDPRGQPWALDRGLCDWLMDLPRPVGVFACNDLWGNQLTEACRQVGRQVPEDVAIVGVDNDDLMCELSRPSLSSVQVPSQAVGESAAALLEHLMAGKKPPAPPLLLPPVQVVVRQSSEALAVEDPLVAAALRYIRSHAHEHFAVSKLLKELAVSRRLLERHFRSHVGRGIWEELRRHRLQVACSMLAGSDEPIGQIALAAGFSDARHLSVTFRTVLKTTPSDHRRLTRGDPPRR
jgi:LacI family transcriptional regulator, galactose operon repressor